MKLIWEIKNARIKLQHFVNQSTMATPHCTEQRLKVLKYGNHLIQQNWKTGFTTIECTFFQSQSKTQRLALTVIIEAYLTILLICQFHPNPLKL
jgi:hypothetical protein